MTDKHPVTPPPELIRKWAQYQAFQAPEVLWLTIATQAANWGADQELEACIKLLSDLGGDGEMIRRHRRHKPLSLAEEATLELDEAAMRGDCVTTTEAMPVLRRALERLQELEGKE